MAKRLSLVGHQHYCLMSHVTAKATKIKHYVEQWIYMKYDVGDKIEVFVSQNDKSKDLSCRRIQKSQLEVRP